MTTNWWEDFFHGVSLDFWRAVISDEQTGAEARFIHGQLQLPIGSKILDVPCGNGRLSLALAKQGFQMTGVDFAAEFIEEAQAKSEAQGLEVDWRLSDMRDLPWSNEFDGAFCFGNSFGYLDDQANTDSLKAFSQALKPGARFILDVPAIAECLLPHLQPHRSMEIADMKVEVDTHYDMKQRRMFNEFTFIRDGKEDKRPSSQRVYEYNELKALLATAGFEPVAEYSSLDGQPFGEGAQRLLLVCRKEG